jgi:hypothetical protein
MTARDPVKLARLLLYAGFRVEEFGRYIRNIGLQSLMLYSSAQAAAFNAIRNSRGEVLEWPNRAAC